MRALTLVVLPALLFLAVACERQAVSTADEPDVQSGTELVQAMYDRYEEEWYRTLTFRQESISFGPSGRADTSIWVEALRLPGELRIDVLPLSNGNGVLFTNNTRFDYREGEMARSVPNVHVLMVLGFDVYVSPVPETVTKLDSLGFDLDVVREDQWNGRPVFVVGAEAGDTTSSQFWVDREHLYFVRMIRPAGPQGQSTMDVRFEDYRRLDGGGWIAPTVEFRVDGELVFLEKYDKIRTDVELQDDLFDPQQWVQEDHWYTRTGV